jgi:hypothetical protein
MISDIVCSREPPSAWSSAHARSAAIGSYCATAAPRSPSLTARETNSAACDGHRAAGGLIGSDTVPP